MGTLYALATGPLLQVEWAQGMRYQSLASWVKIAAIPHIAGLL